MRGDAAGRAAEALASGGRIALGELAAPQPSVASEAPTLTETPGARPCTIPPPSRTSVLPPPRTSYPPPRTSYPPPRTSILPGGLPHPSTHGSAHDSVLQSPTIVRALHAEEAARTSGFGRAIALLCVIGLVFQPLLAPAGWLRAVLCVVLVAMLSVSLWVHLRARREERYDVKVFRIYAAACVLASPFIVYYCGVFSPAPLLVTLGISFFGLGDDHRFALGASIVACALYMLLATAVILGLLPEAGLFPSTQALPYARVFMLVLVPSGLVVTLSQARLSRRAQLVALQRSNEAIRLAAQREAQLDEAHLFLERALRAGAGQGGRYTGMLAGRYCMAELIGRGAMGEVYAAEHVDTGERAAVKLLSATGLSNPALVERFLREGEMAQRLVAPNVVRVLEVGAAEDGAPFIAMELLQGEDLAHHLRHREKLELHGVVDLVRQVARGLSAAHAASIVHRDLKPQNLFLAETGDKRLWKILDFGVSKLSGSSGTLTRHAVIGTPGYMSPEQAQGVEADLRSDIFSLGAVAYRALTGRPPFSGPDTPQILFDIVYRAPARPSEVVPSLPRDVDLVLAIALAKRAEDRFANALELAEVLAAASKGRLPVAYRERAQALLTRNPWGKGIMEPRKR